MLFSKIIGQQNIKERLKSNAINERISHAQLFLGPEGSGKLALAIAYAQYISCNDRTEEDSCGVCLSCIKYNKLVHPDLHFVFPVTTTKSPKAVSTDFIEKWRELLSESMYINQSLWMDKLGAENSQGIINVYESAEILRKLSLKTYESEYKVMIIWLPEKMNLYSANKLLKIIEEPPPKTLFILVSENEDKLIQTIRSRIQLVKIPGINKKDIYNSLQKEFDLSEADLEDAAHLCEGNYLKALELINSSERNEKFLTLFATLMRLCHKKDLLKITSWVDSMATQGRERQKSFLMFGARLIRENFAMYTENKDVVYLGKAEKEFSVRFSNFVTEQSVIPMYEEFNKAHFHIERNGNGRIVFLDMALNLIKLLKN